MARGGHLLWRHHLETDEGHASRGIVDSIGRGMIAGFIATFSLSVLHDAIMVVTSALGVRSPAVGLLFHFFVGTLLWGGAFGLMHDHLWGPSWLRGVVFAGSVSLAVLFVALPLGGAGLCGLRLGLTVPIAVLALHLIYGAVLGAVYGALVPSAEQARRIR